MFRLPKKKNLVKKTAKSITVYVSEKHKQVIIARKHINADSIIYEQEDCFVAEHPMNPTELGEEIISSLNLFSIKDANLSSQTPSDWPAYKHSKCKTISGFEKEYIPIFIAGANENNLVLTLEGWLSKESELTVNSSISFYADKDEIGKRVHQVYRAALTGRLF